MPASPRVIMWFRDRLILGGCLVVFSIAPGHAQPADCSEGPIPDQPLTLRTPGSPDRKLPAVQVHYTPRRTTFPDTDKVFRAPELIMEEGTRKTMFDGVVAAQVDFLVVDGEPLDNRVFSLKPAKPGSPE